MSGEARRAGPRAERRFRWAGRIGRWVVGALMRTVRFRCEGEEPIARARAAGRPLVFVFWHGGLLPLLYLHRDQGAVVLVSEHDDGEYVTRLLEAYGFRTTRGSSTRGGVRGLKGLIRAGREGHDLAVTPDGPRGPAGVFKPGALAAARATGLPVVPVALTPTREWRLSSWDRFRIPKPFSTVHVRYGAPQPTSQGAGQDDLEAWADRLGAELRALETEAARAAGVPAPDLSAPRLRPEGADPPRASRGGPRA